MLKGVNIINYLKNYENQNIIYIENINKLLYNDIEEKNIKNISEKDISIFHNEIIVVNIIYNYRYSVDSLHGYLNIYLENFIDKTVINLDNYDKKTIVYFQTENINIFPTSLENLIIILNKIKNSECINNDDLINDQNCNNTKRLCKYINDNSNHIIREIFIRIKNL